MAHPDERNGNTRPTGLTAEGWWQIGVRRTVPLSSEAAWARLRELVDDDAVRGVRSETPGRVLRANYQPEGWEASTTLQLRVLPAVTGTTLAVHHERLPDAETREAMRRHWTEALERLIADG